MTSSSSMTWLQVEQWHGWLYASGKREAQKRVEALGLQLWIVRGRWFAATSAAHAEAMDTAHPVANAYPPGWKR